MRLWATPLLALLASALGSVSSCERPFPVSPSPGGSPGTGGEPSVGGGVASGGSSTGGVSSSPGGTSAVLPPLVCLPKVRTLMRPAYLLGAKLSPRSGTVLGFLTPPVEVRSVAWAPLNPHCLTQVVGSCVGYGLAEFLSTVPGTLLSSIRTGDILYHQATLLDSFAGTWPPDDTGSDIASGWRGAQQLGYVKAYELVDTLAGIEARLQEGPGTFAGPWSEPMFDVDSTGRAHYDPAKFVGGHHWAIVVLDVERRLLIGRNTWGDQWGCLFNGNPGYFSVSFEDAASMLASGALAGFPVR